MSEYRWTDDIPALGDSYIGVREVTAADASSLHELLGEPSVSHHMAAPPPSLDAFSGFIEWARRQRQHGESVCFGIVPSGLQAAVGIIQVRALEPSFFTAEWGFAIGSAFWGTGVFPEAAYLVARFAFETMGVHRLEARAVAGNGRGNGALLKLGARPEGELKAAFRRDAAYEPQLLWSLSAADLRRPALAHDRFSLDNAVAAIKKNIDEAEASRAEAPPAGAATPPLHPFFITQRRRN